MSIITKVIEKGEREFEEKFLRLGLNIQSMTDEQYIKHGITGRQLKDHLRQSQLALLQAVVEGMEQELEIQKQVQEKSKEVVAIGRARVAGMVADKYTRMGKIEALTSKVNRVEVINHTKPIEEGGGRAYVFWEDKAKVELSLQDDGRTLKIFISNGD